MDINKDTMLIIETGPYCAGILKMAFIVSTATVGLDIFGLEEYFYWVKVQNFVYASHGSSENKQVAKCLVQAQPSTYYGCAHFKIPAQ